MDQEPKYYVYTYSFSNGQPFYVGKGTGNRCFRHLSLARNNKLFSDVIIQTNEILKSDEESIITKLIQNIDEELAFLLRKNLFQNMEEVLQ
jgi:hypothetical protein